MNDGGDCENMYIIRYLSHLNGLGVKSSSSTNTQRLKNLMNTNTLGNRCNLKKHRPAPYIRPKNITARSLPSSSGKEYFQVTTSYY